MKIGHAQLEPKAAAHVHHLIPYITLTHAQTGMTTHDNREKG